jgi:hypothetical protein
MAPKPEEIPIRNDNNGSIALKDINATTVLKVIDIPILLIIVMFLLNCLHIVVICFL